jgi:uncharacterized protein YndB with AHSA1/START domain
MASPSDRRTDRASREIDASPDELDAAFADAATLMTWLPPGDMRGEALEYDFREGGRYRIALTYAAASDGARATGKSGDGTDVSQGRFVALEPGRRIVQSVEFESDQPEFSGEMQMTWTFEPIAGGTEVSIVAENVPPGITEADHAEGLRSSLDNLAAFAHRSPT